MLERKIPRVKIILREFSISY